MKIYRLGQISLEVVQRQLSLFWDKVGFSEYSETHLSIFDLHNNYAQQLSTIRSKRVGYMPASKASLDQKESKFIYKQIK